MNDNNEQKDINKFFNDIPQSNVGNNNGVTNQNAQSEIKASGVIPMEDNKEVINDSNTISIEKEDTTLPEFSNNAATIGEIKPDKQKSPITMLVLFVLLISFILFMPNIISLANKYLGTNFNTNNGVNTDPANNNNDDDNKKEEDTNDSRIYTISPSLSIKIGSLVLSGFEKIQSNELYQFKFNIQNTGTATYQFNKKLYVDFFNSNDTFIERKLIDITSISSGSNEQISVNISKEVYDTGHKVEAVLRDVDDYPQVSITDNQLQCSKDNRIITYTFKDNKLIAIKDNTKYYKTGSLESYSNELVEKKMIIKNMDSIDGVTAILVEDDSGYETTININYESTSYDKLTYKDKYYEKNTLSKVIDFELKASDYTCN